MPNEIHCPNHDVRWFSVLYQKNGQNSLLFFLRSFTFYFDNSYTDSFMNANTIHNIHMESGAT